MKNSVAFAELRRVLLTLGFRELSRPGQVAFGHQPSDTLFLFRAYRPDDPVASYNLIEVRDMLAARGLMAAEAFDNQFRKAPA
jgi:hypothetical protein